MSLLPGEELGITVLTNGEPVGLADSVALDFFDTAQYGKPTADWLSLAAQVYQQGEEAGRSPTDYTKPPGTRPTPSPTTRTRAPTTTTSTDRSPSRPRRTVN